MQALTKDHADYPASLIGLADAPQILYVLGNLDLLYPNPTVALVGARMPTVWALKGSPLSTGSDDSAHRGCLEAGGLTVAVLGSSLGSIENPKKQQMADAILNALAFGGGADFE